MIDRRSGVSADSIYLRLYVENVGRAAARNAEVYAKDLQMLRADEGWESVRAFPPMNLRWANTPQIYFPSIGPGMGKHCDVAHIIDVNIGGVHTKIHIKQ